MPCPLGDGPGLCTAIPAPEGKADVKAPHSLHRTQHSKGATWVGWHDAWVDPCLKLAPVGLWPLSHVLSLNPLPPQAALPISISPPSALHPPVSPVLTSLHSFPFPWLPRVPPDCRCFTALCPVHEAALTIGHVRPGRLQGKGGRGYGRCYGSMIESLAMEQLRFKVGICFLKGALSHKAWSIEHLWPAGGIANFVNVPQRKGPVASQNLICCLLHAPKGECLPGARPARYF